MFRCPSCAGRTEWTGLYSRACPGCSLRLRGRPTPMTFFLRIVGAALPFLLVPLAMIAMPNALGGALLAIGVCFFIGVAIELGSRRWLPEHSR